MRLFLLFTLLCSLSISLAGPAHSTPAASKKTKATKLAAAQKQGTDNNLCADTAKCSPVFVSNLAIVGDAYKTYRPASLPSGIVSTGKSASLHQSTSAHGKSHKAATTTAATSAHNSSPTSKSEKLSPTPKGTKPSQTHKSKKPSQTHKSKKPSPTHKSEKIGPTHKKSHARSTEDDTEFSITNNHTKLVTPGSSELVRRHGRDWTLTKRTPGWTGINVPQGGVSFASQNQGIYTTNLNSCSAVLAIHNRGTVLAHLVCANNPSLSNPYGSVEHQYANFVHLVTQRLGTTDIGFRISMPAQQDNGFAQVQAVPRYLERDFPPTSGNTLMITNRAASS